MKSYFVDVHNATERNCQDLVNKSEQGHGAAAPGYLLCTDYHINKAFPLMKCIQHV